MGAALRDGSFYWAHFNPEGGKEHGIEEMSVFGGSSTISEKV